MSLDCLDFKRKERATGWYDASLTDSRLHFVRPFFYRKFPNWQTELAPRLILGLW